MERFDAVRCQISYGKVVIWIKVGEGVGVSLAGAGCA